MTLRRRSILQLGVATGGALAIGLELGGCAFAPVGSGMRRHHAATGELRVAAWLRLLPDDQIVLALDRVEMGQGTTTGHAMLVAEELEVAPTRIRVEHAPSDRAFGNPKLAGFQITGGSTSTQGAWGPLRRAGAAARELLRRGAATTWGVPLAECHAADGEIHHAPSGRRARYGELLAAAAAHEVDDVPLKPRSQFRWIGTAVDRLDARDKIDGRAIYGLDVRLPGMLTAVIVRAPVPGAKVQGFDATRARARPGVVAVFEVSTGIAVVARGYWAARTAAADVEVRWDEPPLARWSSPAIERELERMTRTEGRAARSDGNAARALGRSARRVEAVYVQPFLAHATMEPQNATAWLHDGRCEVWAPTQAPGIAQAQISELTGLPPDAIDVHTTMIGGAFGRRTEQDYALEAVEVARTLKVPVQVVWSRADDFENDFYRPIAVARAEGGLDAGGRISALRYRVVSPSILDRNGGLFVGATLPARIPRAIRRVAVASPRALARGLIADPLSAEGAAELPYAIPAVRVEVAHAELRIPVGFWRSVGHSHNAMAVESFVDELLHAGGRDPYRGRRELLAAHPRLLAVLDLAATKAGWGKALPAGRGRGIAVHASFGSACAQVIEVAVEGTGVRVLRVVVALDCGLVMNPQIVRAQMEGSVVFGLSAALREQITFARGRVEQRDFAAYGLLRMYECPPIEVHFVPGGTEPQGVGEPGVPPVAPALCNAIFAATGIRIRRLPVEPALAAALLARSRGEVAS
ncbi:MAG: xanthine dehydrogenase family protein molybdopterin-binding subunit [Kofleriaceae bacterium]|nr:xanthine dehydrogenase family protein molybdopterin-binding subunit [Kofleriaceae bacterium]